MRFKDKAAIVTGAGSGFGEGIAKRLAGEGAQVLIADINDAGGQRVAKEIGSAAVFQHADVTKSAEVKAMVETAVARFGRLDILINNAGFTHRNMPMLEVPEDIFDRVFATNVKSIYLGAIHAVPVLTRQGGGVIINIASTAGVRPRPGLTWYNGSKGAAILLTRSMAVELAPQKIRVCAVNPVAGETAMLKDFMGQDTPEMRAKFIGTIPLGRLSLPKDIAAATAFLASDDAEFLTGVCLEVDGGRCI